MNAVTDDAVPNEAQLTIPEAVLLGHALVARVAESRGIRVFFIKGPASVQQGLRLPKVSVDVDVFVAPADIEQLLDGLRERGWLERHADRGERIYPNHSVTVNHSSWPCCIDVHFRFPGMEGDPTECFDVMWAHTETLELAGQDMRVPSKALGTVILSLHALRTPHLLAAQQELECLSDVSTRNSWGAAVLEIANRTNSLAALRPFLEEMVPVSIASEWPENSLEWSNRLRSKEPGSARIIAIAQAPLRKKPRMLFAAIFPPGEVFLTGSIYADLSLAGRLRAHQARWRRFLRSAPRLIRDLSQRPRAGHQR